MSANYTPTPFDASQGVDVGSYNTQDEFVGYGTAFNNPDRFVLHLDERIHMINPSASPLYSWASAVRKSPIGGYTFSWMVDEYFTHRDVKAILTYDSTNAVWTLKMPEGGDWQAFEAAAEADPWDDNKPLAHIKVKKTDGTAEFYAVLNQKALYKGPTVREYTCDDGATKTIANEFVLNDYSDGSDVVGGTESEIRNVTKGDGTGVAAVSGDYGYGKAFTSVKSSYTSAASFEVYVQMVTPNEYLQGFAQGSGLPNESRKRSRTFTNFTQIFKTPFSVSDTLLHADMHGPNELARLRLKKAIEHKIDIERAFLFQGGGVLNTDWGVLPDPTSGSSNPLTRFKGLGIGKKTLATAGWITTKNGDLDSRFTLNSSTATPNDVMNLCAALFDDTVDQPASTKVVFASQKWLLALANLAYADTAGKWRFGDIAMQHGTLGMEVRNLQSPVGNLRFVPMPLLRGMYEDYALVMDLRNMAIRPQKGRDTTLKTDTADKTLDGQLDYYITEVGFELHHESTNGIIKLA